jgi:branched-chain amino acid transport system ATP-binding protein
MLHVEEIHTYYGSSHVLHGVSLRVAAGELVCLLGRNGAGKTTTIRSIVGFNPPRAGRVVLGGRDVTGLPAHRIARLGVGLVPQGRRIFPDLTVHENLVFAWRRGGAWDPQRAYQLFPRLKERANNYGSQLSGGEQQMLAIGRALLMNPSLLLMDEPSEGLAPLVVREVGAIIAELKQAGMAILLAEQNLGLALSVADRAYILSQGRSVHESTAESLRHDEAVKHQYLAV